MNFPDGLSTVQYNLALLSALPWLLTAHTSPRFHRGGLNPVG